MIRLLTETIAAALGSVAFSLLFGAPSTFYPECAFAGGFGWLLLRVLTTLAGLPATLATFLAAVAVALYARIAAVRRRCPSTVFLIAGIFPLVPGAGIYWTVYYLVTGEAALALSSGATALKAAFAIVLAIAAAFELPGGVFRCFAPRR
ncbi:MAG: threonine/serine exporter family protein [Candidatus Ventricola sp.]